jgi:hypothetical protein
MVWVSSREISITEIFDSRRNICRDFTSFLDNINECGAVMSPTFRRVDVDAPQQSRSRPERESELQAGV